MAQLPPQSRPHNALSNAPSGTSYTGLGCFPLGHHITPAETADLTQTLHSLRKNKLLHQISPADHAAIKTHLAPLQQAQVFWAHHARDAPVAKAIAELLDLLEHTPKNFDIYTFPDSTLLSAGAPTVWGLSEVSSQEDKTYLYVSALQTDLAGTVMHTFLSSRGISRLQCFLAEYVLADQAGRLTEDWALPERLQRDLGLLRREELRGLAERLDGEGRLEAPVLLAKLAGLCEELLEKMEESG